MKLRVQLEISLQEKFPEIDTEKIFVSLSHEKELSIGFVVIGEWYYVDY